MLKALTGFHWEDLHQPHEQTMDVANHLHVGRRDTGQYSLVEVSVACQQHTVGLQGEGEGGRKEEGRRDGWGGGEEGRERVGEKRRVEGMGGEEGGREEEGRRDGWGGGKEGRERREENGRRDGWVGVERVRMREVNEFKGKEGYN